MVYFGLYTPCTINTNVSPPPTLCGPLQIKQIVASVIAIQLLQIHKNLSYCFTLQFGQKTLSKDNYSTLHYSTCVYCAQHYLMWLKKSLLRRYKKRKQVYRLDTSITSVNNLKSSLRLQGQKIVEQLVLQHLQCCNLCQFILPASLPEIS